MHSFEAKLAESWQPDRWTNVTVLVAVSGGADSVALLRGLASLMAPDRGRLIVGHLNHGLRGDESHADASFVARLAQQLGLPAEMGETDIVVSAQKWGLGLEESSRRARYEFLQSAAERQGARYVAVAHTANDQAETILHRIIRGTGLRGLAGMPRTRLLGPAVTLIRPLLSVTRTEVEYYLASIGQGFREDRSNTDLQFTRNRIRHELLPALERNYNPAVSDALLRLGALAGELQQILKRQTSQLVERTVQFDAEHSVMVDCCKLHGNDRYLVREVFVSIWQHQHWPQQRMSYAEWDALAELALGIQHPDETSTKILPGTVTAQKKREQLTLTRLEVSGSR